jgi:hypothetical protein
MFKKTFLNLRFFKIFKEKLMKTLLLGLSILGSISIHAASKECTDAIDRVIEASGTYSMLLTLKDKKPSDYKLTEELYKAEREIKKAYEDALEICK